MYDKTWHLELVNNNPVIPPLLSPEIYQNPVLVLKKYELFVPEHSCGCKLVSKENHQCQCNTVDNLAISDLPPYEMVCNTGQYLDEAETRIDIKNRNFPLCPKMIWRRNLEFL